MKIAITTDASWHTLLTALGHLADSMYKVCPQDFALYDAERLEAIARIIRSTCPQESQ